MRWRGGVRWWTPVWCGPVAWACLYGCAGRPPQPSASDWGSAPPRAEVVDRELHREIPTAVARVEQPADAAAPAVAEPSLLEAAMPSAATNVATATGAADDQAIDANALETTLRRELAAASDPAPAALELMGLLCDLERHQEALAVADAALRRTEAPELVVARAGVLRDLGQRHEAVAVLLALRSQHGDKALHPGLLFELAELQVLEGAPAAARATLAALRQVHADDSWLLTAAPQLQALEGELERPGGPLQVRIRDLLGNLRGAPSPYVRQIALEQLLAAELPDSARLPLQAQVVAIGVGDESPAVRARTLQLAPLQPAAMAELLSAALQDPAPLVRAAAAGRAAGCLGSAGIAVLRDQLATETDPATFTALHAALRELEPGRPPLSFGAADTAAGRAAAAAWNRP